MINPSAQKQMGRGPGQVRVGISEQVNKDRGLEPFVCGVCVRDGDSWVSWTAGETGGQR